MLDRYKLPYHGNIPELSGTVCEALLCQQYWHRGQLVEDVNALFLKVSHHQWQMFFFDSGVLFWRQQDPNVLRTSVKDEHHYPCIDLGERYNLIHQTIEYLEITEKAPRPAILIRFSLSNELLLADEGECMVLSIR